MNIRIARGWLFRASLGGTTALAAATMASVAFGDQPTSLEIEQRVAPRDIRQLRLAQSTVAVSYGYDPIGRIASALYDDGTCVTYTYDANGNSTAHTVTKSDTPETGIWGSGVWGCFKWSP